MGWFSGILSLAHQDGPHIKMLIVIAVMTASAFAIQRIFKNDLERDQYYYMRDLCLVASWAICGIWTESPPMKLMITAGVISGLVGFCQKVLRGQVLRLFFIAIGLGVSFLGPRISFIGQPEGEFLYISNVAAVMMLSALWISIFPILLQEIDEIPGLGGCFLLSGWTMMMILTFMSSKGPSDAAMMALCGAALIAVFWSRHANVYRRLGNPLAAMWGALLAGTSMLGSSNGVAFAPVMVLTLGVFAVPILESMISVLSALVSPKPISGMMFYRVLVSRGLEHASAVYVVTLSCSICGALFSAVQLGICDLPSALWAALFSFVGLFALCCRMFRSVDSHSNSRRELWGLIVDNMSLDYALGRVSGWLASGESKMIVTPDALAALRSRADEEYSAAVREAGLVIPDGTGLVWALKILGTPVRERMPGVEFSDHLCRIAASRGAPVFFFGGKSGVAEKAAERQAERHKGLIIAGCRDGYFNDEESSDIAEQIRRSGARIVLIALGVPKQEIWARRHIKQMGSVITIGVGGTLDVMSGTIERAPQKWRDMHLEWLYRTLKEPSRWRRTIKLPLFVVLVLMKRLGIGR